jgi:hypothetical protein
MTLDDEMESLWIAESEAKQDAKAAKLKAREDGLHLGAVVGAGKYAFAASMRRQGFNRVFVKQGAEGWDDYDNAVNDAEQESRNADPDEDPSVVYDAVMVRRGFLPVWKRKSYS